MCARGGSREIRLGVVVCVEGWRGGGGAWRSWLVSLELFFLSDVFDENGLGRELGFGAEG